MKKKLSTPPYSELPYQKLTPIGVKFWCQILSILGTKIDWIWEGPNLWIWTLLNRPPGGPTDPPEAYSGSIGAWGWSCGPPPQTGGYANSCYAPPHFYRFSQFLTVWPGGGPIGPKKGGSGPPIGDPPFEGGSRGHIYTLYIYRSLMVFLLRS